MSTKRTKTRVISLALGETANLTGFYALGILFAYAKSWQHGVLNNFFEFEQVKSYGRNDFDGLMQEIDQIREPAIYLFSCFFWTHEFNHQFATRIKKNNPGSLILFGGVDVPKRSHELVPYMKKNTHIDVSAFGEGEIAFVKTLDHVAKNSTYDERGIIFPREFPDIKGIAYRTKEGEILSSVTGEQIQDLDSIPSPYLNEIFNDAVYNEWIFIETNRGCPFGCTYCDWGGATASKVRSFSLDRVKQELEFIAKKRVHRIHITDANFGAQKRDMEITDHIVSMSKKYGFPKLSNASYAKNATKRVADIIEKLYRNGLVDKALISFQTLDTETLENIDRGNIKLKSYHDLLRIFKKLKIPITTELIFGLPGQTLAKVANDINYCIEHMVVPQAFLVKVLVNAPMADPEYIKKYNLKTNENNNIISSFSFTEDDMKKIMRFNLAQLVFVQEGFLKYIFYYYQIEHKIRAVDIIIRFMNFDKALSEKYPWIAEFMARMLNMRDKDLIEFMHPVWKKEKSKLILDNLDKFYADCIRFVADEYGVHISNDIVASLTALQMALMQKPHRELPDTKLVPHDVVEYFSQLERYVSISEIDSHFKPLHDFPPGEIHTPKQYIKKFPYDYVRSPMRYLPEWPLYVNGLVFQPYTEIPETLPSYHKHFA